MIIQTNESGLMRDMSSRAILIDNEKARQEFKNKHAIKKRMERLARELDDLRCSSMLEMNVIKSELSEIKHLILKMRK